MPETITYETRITIVARDSGGPVNEIVNVSSAQGPPPPTSEEMAAILASLSAQAGAAWDEAGVEG